MQVFDASIQKKSLKSSPYRLDCALSLFHVFFVSSQAKHMIMLRDSVIQDIIQFLEHCESKFHFCMS